MDTRTKCLSTLATTSGILAVPHGVPLQARTPTKNTSLVKLIGWAAQPKEAPRPHQVMIPWLSARFQDLLLCGTPRRP